MGVVVYALVARGNTILSEYTESRYAYITLDSKHNGTHTHTLSRSLRVHRAHRAHREHQLKAKQKEERRKRKNKQTNTTLSIGTFLSPFPCVCSHSTDFSSKRKYV